MREPMKKTIVVMPVANEEKTMEQLKEIYYGSDFLCIKKIAR